MSSETRDQTTHVAMLRALEFVASARSMVEQANGNFQTAERYQLYEKVMADLDATSKDCQTLLSYTSSRA
jgi:hypothetical protein